MMIRAYRLLIILASVFVGTAMAGYSFEPADLTNSTGPHDAQINSPSNSLNNPIMSETALPPDIIKQPEDAACCTGGSALFSVAASGTEPLSYQWYKNDTAIHGESCAALIIDSVSLSDAGNYTVNITNSCGTAISRKARLIVNSPPMITAQPDDISTYEGRAVSFKAAVSGVGPISYQWIRGTTPIHNAISANFYIPMVLSSDIGTYRVVVTNSCGSATSRDATLKVLSPPVIPVQPSTRTVAEGASITFAIGARGTGLTYQWKKDGTKVPGATSSSYYIAHAALADAGTYSIVVSNGYCSAESSLIQLVVKNR